MRIEKKKMQKEWEKQRTNESGDGLVVARSNTKK